MPGKLTKKWMTVKSFRKYGSTNTEPGLSLVTHLKVIGNISVMILGVEQEFWLEEILAKIM